VPYDRSAAHACTGCASDERRAHEGVVTASSEAVKGGRSFPEELPAAVRSQPCPVCCGRGLLFAL